MVLWEELLVVGRLGWKKNTFSDLPPTPVLLARAEVLATEVFRHLHLVPKDQRLIRMKRKEDARVMVTGRCSIAASKPRRANA